MTATQPNTLTPTEAKRTLPTRFAQACRTAEVKAMAVPHRRQCVYWCGNQFVVVSESISWDDYPLAIFDRKGKL